jgi:hypothetical protein
MVALENDTFHASRDGGLVDQPFDDLPRFWAAVDVVAEMDDLVAMRRARRDGGIG